MVDQTAAPSPSIDTPAAPTAPAFPGSTPASPGVQLNAEAAKARRDAIIKDPVWRDRYVNGDVGLREEMRALNMAISEEPDGTKVDRILAGTQPLGKMEVLAHGELPTVNLMSAVDGLRQNGLPDQVIKEIIEGTPVTAERHREAAIIKQQLLADKAWVAAYRDGSRLHAEQLHRVLAVLTAPIIESEAK
jgi:hypothetical protein